MTRDGSKVSLVTGAASGLGRVTALALVARGDRVAICDRDGDGVRETASMIEAAGGSVASAVCDVATVEGGERAVAIALDAFGGLDNAVNNAGVEGARAPAGDYDPDEWRRVLSINLDGVFYCMRAEIAAMRARGGGAIVNVGSTASLGGVAGMAAYTASKHGLLGLTRAAALDHAAQNIRVNALCPGSFLTPMSDRLFGDNLEKIVADTPMRRLGSVEEIASVIEFLCSDASSFMTGAAVPVEGGKRAR
jgi:NAD(P)-dependent dehydrogenase (short-subunit alcohol dehydrogenase family)